MSMVAGGGWGRHEATDDHFDDRHGGAAAPAAKQQDRNVLCLHGLYVGLTGGLNGQVYVTALAKMIRPKGGCMGRWRL